MEPNVWLIWQLADSAFPSGGFAHSAGLEAMWQFGHVGDGKQLESALETMLGQTARAALPFVQEAHRKRDQLAEIDAVCDAFLSNHVANRASRAQGQAWLSTAAKVFATPTMTQLRSDLKRSQSQCHFAPVFGAVGSVLELSSDQTADLFMFLSLRGAISAAVRLGIVGPLEAQAMQAQLSPKAAELARQSIGIDDAAQVAPMLDLLQGTQDRLYSRLFQS